MVIAAIIGPDGCGKTTQSKMLVDRLKSNGFETMYIRPVYVLMNLIRMKEGDENLVSPRRARVSESSNKKLYTLRRASMVFSGYPYALTTYLFMRMNYRNKIIICDRYFYQFFFDLFGDLSEKVIEIFPKPDIAFFLDGDLDFLYSRMDDAFDVSVDRDYYIAVINLYRRISQKYGFIRIDAKLYKERINDIMFVNLTKGMSRRLYEKE